MMILRYSHASPFARKVAVVANELGITDQLQLRPTQVRVDDPELFSQNPLAKIPVLITENGEPLFDSKVICEYLDVRFGGGRLTPAGGDARWRALTWINLSDGMTDAGLLARQEHARDPSSRSEDAVRFQLAKVERGLDWFNTAPNLDPHEWGMKEIALACALEWLIFRFGDFYTLNKRAYLANWYASVKTKPSFADPARP